MLLVATVELVFYALNENIGFCLGAVDLGGAMFVHTFGAYFGCVSTLVGVIMNLFIFILFFSILVILLLYYHARMMRKCIHNGVCVTRGIFSSTPSLLAALVPKSLTTEFKITHN